MKIALITPILAARAGGAEYVICSVAGSLADVGHDVEILHYADDPGAPFYDVHPKVGYFSIRPKFVRYGGLFSRIHRSFGLSSLGNILPKMRWKATRGHEARWLEDYLSCYRPDLVIAVTAGCFSITAYACKKLGIPYVLSIHNVPKKEFEDPTRWDPNPVDMKIRKDAIKDAAAITILSNSFKSYFDEAFYEKIYVIPNFVEVVEPSQDETNENAIRQIVSVGRLADVKQHDLLLKAWSQIASDFPEWTVSVYGHGPKRFELRKLIREHGLENSFILRGPSQRIWDAYRASAFMVHPAKFEGFGLVVLEAMHCAIPTIAFSDCPGVNELIVHEKTGILVDPREDRERELARAIRTMINAEEDRRRMGTAAQVRAQDFSEERSLGIWKEMIKSVVSV